MAPTLGRASLRAIMPTAHPGLPVFHEPVKDNVYLEDFYTVALAPALVFPKAPWGSRVAEPTAV